MGRFTGATILAAMLGTSAFAQDFIAAPLRPGVYECYNQNATTVPLMFGLIDSSTYMDAGGRQGRYAYDAASGVLSLDAGSPTPARYKRVAVNNFRLLRENGELGGFVCPLNPAKDPRRPPW